MSYDMDPAEARLEIERLQQRVAIAEQALEVKERLNETLRRELDAAHAELRDQESAQEELRRWSP